ncbi:hypothetical protein [Aurantimonas sp. Leaf443]|uniref:hypothetical protein n=1 Tax=Aurantimonas sp. Leaf443 TaxID=1736378 RepID=UPI0012E3B26E|nr:hypothetical protein [Aurantimonas sp. Leaf443]
MHLAVFAVSRSPDKIAFLEEHKERVVPVSATRDGYLADVRARISVMPFLFQDGDLQRFASRVTTFLEGKQGFVILLDGDGFQDLESSYCEAAICVRGDFGLKGPKDRSANAFQSTLASGLRAFSVISSRFDDYKYQKILLLPVKNFHFDAWDELCDHVCRSERDRNFQRIVQEKLSKLLERQSPKRYEKGRRERERFHFDERDLYFQHGHEHHAHPDTKSPPHTVKCIMNADWRFGRTFDRQRHFNVSGERPVGGFSATFWDCHGREELIERNDKLDLFTNSFWT